jgi:hypothetical protein
MERQKNRAIAFGVAGLILIVLGIKYFPTFMALVRQEAALQNQAAILFFNVDQPCECMVELTGKAEQQISAWPAERRANLPLVHLWMEERKDLEARYKVFRAPCLVLVDEKGEVAWRQDYPLIEGGPFKLDELEAAIAALENQ